MNRASDEDRIGDAEILNLPHCVLEQVLLHLEARDIANFGSTCTALREAALLETLWAAFARKKWGHLTNVQDWISTQSQGIFQWLDFHLPIPSTYR